MRKCIVCGGDRKNSLFDASVQVPEPYPLSGQQRIVQCFNCGFIYADSQNTMNEYVQYYTTLNKHKKRAVDASELDLAYFRKIMHFLDDVPIDATILDFGSGDLLLSNMLQKKGYNHIHVWDVDVPSKHDEKFDLIVSTHTFEHIINADTILEQLVDLLKIDGSILLAVPDISQCLNYYCGPFNIFDLEHINHFSLDTLRQFAFNHGLSLVKDHTGKREVRPNLFYPEVMVLCQRAKKQETYKSDAYSGAESAALEYIKKSQTHFNSAGKKIADLSNKRLIFWGIGIYLMRLAYHYPGLKGAFVDSDHRLWGKQFLGHKIISPDSLDVSSPEGVVFVVAAVNASDIVAAIQKRYGDAAQTVVL